MTASATDKLKRVGQRGTKTTLASPGKAPSDTSVTLTNPANWETETGIFCSFYEEDPITKKEKDGTYTVWEGVVVGSQVVALNQVYGPTGVTYPAGAIAVMHINSAWANDVIDALRSFMNQDRTLKKDPIKAALGISGDTPPDWNLLPVTPTVTGNFGQREHELTFDGVDYTTTLGEGTKLRLPRTGTTPTQSMKFDPASNQYASKTSPAGITPTTTLTCEAWVHLDKYPTGAGSQTSGTIISRYNTTGFICRFDTFGRLMLSGYTASDHRTVTAQQSVELGKKVHVSASINTATNTGVITCDGVVVSTIMSGGATSLVQAGNLEIGAYDGANGLINGKLSQVRIWKTVRTPQEIRDNMNVEITTHPDLIANFPGNGNFNDVSGNNNHLTPSGGAVATHVDNPFHDIEYAIVTTKPVFAGGNTKCRVFTGQASVLPNAALAAASYSNAETPTGFPSSKGNWNIKSIFNVQQDVSGPGWQRGAKSPRITVPAGRWKVGYNLSVGGYTSSYPYVGGYVTLSKLTNNSDDPELTLHVLQEVAGSGIRGTHMPAARSKYVENSATQDYNVLTIPEQASGMTMSTWGEHCSQIVEAELSYI